MEVKHDTHVRKKRFMEVNRQRQDEIDKQIVEGILRDARKALNHRNNLETPQLDPTFAVKLEFNGQEFLPCDLTQVFKFKKVNTRSKKLSDYISVNRVQYKYTISFPDVTIIIKYDDLVNPVLPGSSYGLPIINFSYYLQCSPMYPKLTAPDEEILNFLKKLTPIVISKCFCISKLSLKNAIDQVLLNRFLCLWLWFRTERKKIDCTNQNIIPYILYSNRNNVIKVIGYILVEKQERRYNIRHHLIIPSEQHKGLGTFLLHEVYKDLLKTNAELIQIKETHSDRYEKIQLVVEYTLVKDNLKLINAVERVFSIWKESKDNDVLKKSLILTTEQLKELSIELKITHFEIQAVFEIMVELGVIKRLKEFDVNGAKFMELYNEGLRHRILMENHPNLKAKVKPMRKDYRDKYLAELKLTVNKFFTLQKMLYSNVIASLN